MKRWTVLLLAPILATSLALGGWYYTTFPEPTPVQAYDPGFPPKPKSIVYQTPSAEHIHALINAERQKVGLPQLRLNAALGRSALAKCMDIQAENNISHVSNEGRADYWISRAGYAFTRWGENLAWRWQTDEQTVNGWMRSPTHRANVLGNYLDEGLATCPGPVKNLIVQHLGI